MDGHRLEQVGAHRGEGAHRGDIAAALAVDVLAAPERLGV